jgi:hypothetical protein
VCLTEDPSTRPLCLRHYVSHNIEIGRSSNNDPTGGYIQRHPLFVRVFSKGRAGIWGKGEKAKEILNVRRK